MKRGDIVVRELESIRKKNPKGILLPEDVVEAARPPQSPLHDKFNWDNNEAAHAWRLHQARMLIRVLVTIEPATNEGRRVFVSLSTDRDTGGYRPLATVLRNEDQRAQLLEDAKRDMRSFKQKYSRLVELVEVFEAMEKQL